MVEVRHQYATVQGHRVFYREAGSRVAPTLVLLHGFPSSSRMFRHLIPALADRFHVIAPDHLGFDNSDVPPVDAFTYTFDSLTDITEALLAQLDVTRYAVYVQDYGAPIGWRLALRTPGRGHRGDHAERQRLRGRLRTGFLEARVGVLREAGSPDGTRRPYRPLARGHPLAVPARSGPTRAGRSRHLGR
ncbi:alpha/beta fold hydrolase [Streptomyces sp. NPDC057474]|uniref:alpha/beta fold hydrolase n=1 Tax=Streptomyces sp. NPDC057474 TaxID=3346144 RepID=UPI00369C8341